MALNPSLHVTHYDSPSSLRDLNDPYYFVVLFEGDATFTIDFVDYTCRGKNIVFLSPYQLLTWHAVDSPAIAVLRFHGDFYCIEYHKEEVACNGILFNNIYDKPVFSVPDIVFEEITQIFKKIERLQVSTVKYDVSLAKTYLQLVLALSSREKQVQLGQSSFRALSKDAVQHFPMLLDEYYAQHKSVHFYADQYGLSVDAFSKKVKKYFGKSPSKLIRERLTLEAKKLLHLSYASIKEIAYDLGFEDEFYFSRYFKKAVGVSPKSFREQVGISIVAK